MQLIKDISTCGASAGVFAQPRPKVDVGECAAESELSAAFDFDQCIFRTCAILCSAGLEFRSYVTGSMSGLLILVAFALGAAAAGFYAAALDQVRPWHK